MRKLFIILGIIASVLALVLSVLPLSNLAYFPAIAALLFGLMSFYISNKNSQSVKTVQLVFLLTIIALSISIYKSIFQTVEVGNTEELQVREQQSEEEAIEELEDLDLEELDLE
ncbi:FUSC family protein [Xanthomarina gelatinilytica]|uniref:FUSC family protein n=1 Tax=Xanthomarina gelatinilytica TaxID=1137281 RepID=UPI003AA9CC10